VPAHAETLASERVNFITEFTLEHAGTDQPAADYLGEQLFGLLLGTQERLFGCQPGGLPGRQICA
jgi:hypothetical protein